jgi:sugar phosphate isomerase/epimerase
MRLGIGSFTYPWACGLGAEKASRPLTPFDLLAKAEALGVRVVQICDNLPLERLNAEERQRLAGRARELGVQIEVGTRGTGRAHLLAQLELARLFRSPILRVVLGSATERVSVDEAVDALRPLMGDLESAGVGLAIENHDALPARTLRELVERLGFPRVGVCLDTANSLGCLEGLETTVETLAPYTLNLHVKDVVVRRLPHHLGFTVEGRPAGEGQVEIPWVLERLRVAGRDVSVILEQWPAPEADAAATRAKEEAWAVAGVGYLRKLIRD